MKYCLAILAAVFSLSRCSWAKETAAVDAVVCFDSVEAADQVMSAGEVEDRFLSHIHSIQATDLARIDLTHLSLPAPGENTQSYLSRVMARLNSVAPRLASEITSSYHGLVGNISFEKNPIGKTREIRDPEWDNLHLDHDRCVLAPVLVPTDSKLRMDIRLFQQSGTTPLNQTIILLHEYLSQMDLDLSENQILGTIQLYLSSNPSATYDSYLREIGEQGLLPGLPEDGKVWATAGYERLASTIQTLIDQSIPDLQDETVRGGTILRAEVEEFGQKYSQGFTCPRASLPPSPFSKENTDTDFTRFRACMGMISEIQPKESEWGKEILNYLNEKSAVAKTRVFSHYSDPPSDTPEASALREQLEGFNDFTSSDNTAIEDGIGILIQQIGDSVANDGNSSASGSSSGQIELADVFTILRDTPLHYLESTVPQIDSVPSSAQTQVYDVWSGVGDENSSK